jgi:naphthalene 1,2-dioxygenase ferredoxin component
MSDAMDEGWLDVAQRNEVSDLDIKAVRVGDRELALYEVQGEVFATDNQCTHGDARLSDGFLEGNEIECPFHQGRFDVCTGKALCGPLTQDIQTHAVKVDGTRILVKLRTAQKLEG